MTDETDICELEEFKDDPQCKKKKCGLVENIFWALVLISIAFFLTCWNNLIGRLLEKVFGPQRTDMQLALLAAGSLVIVLVLGCYFEVDLTY